MFPSPCGDYGSYLAEDVTDIINDYCECFRPLAGIMVLILADRPDRRHSRIDVSVPLRGLWFLSDEL